MRERDLATMLQDDQRRRWARGDHMAVEDYREQHPALASDPEALLDLILGEVILREQAGQRPTLGEYLGRFPALADPLRLQFEVHQAFDDPEDPLSAPASSSFPTRVPATAPAEDMLETDPAGIDIPGYAIEAELGRGGMGVVYRARQAGLNRAVALKMILAGAHAGAAERGRFRTEAEAVARLQHPNIVQIYEVGEHDGRPFLSLELVEGGSLERRLGGVPQSPWEAAGLVATLAHAVHHVHRHGILHRDLKPSNILLTAEGVPKVTDFGLAKLIDADSGQTPTEALIGTPGYMAPEQASGQARRISARSDVYALGAILYELLTGRPPFRAETPLETLRLVVAQEPVPPARFQPRVPRDLETVCLKCLDKEDTRRYADADALADDLGRFLAGEPIRARPISPWRRLVKWARRRPAAAALAAVSLVAATALLGIGLAVRQAEHGRLARQRADAEQRVFQAQLAAAEGDWNNAKVHVTSALTALGRAPGLAELRCRADRWLAEADRRLDDQAARLAAGRRRDAFHRHRDEVLFRGTQPVDGDAPDQLRITREAAVAALAVFGRMLDEGQPPPAFGPGFERPESLALAQDCYEMLLVLADALAQARPMPPATQHEQATRALEALRVLDRAVDYRAPTRSYHVRRARILDILGKTSAAVDERQKAASLAPAGVLDHFLEGVDLFLGSDGAGEADRGGPARAIDGFERVLAIQPGHFWGRYYLAVCHLNAGHPEPAKIYLTACLEQRPGFLWVYLLRGLAFGRLGDAAAADADFRRAWALDPNAEARYALFVNQGAVRFLQDRLADARSDFERAVALRPDRYQAHVNLALLEKRAGKLPEALESLDRALRASASPPPLVRADLLAERAQILLLAGDNEAVLGACDLAAALRAEVDAKVLGLRAQALLALKQYAPAEAAFTLYLKRGGPPGADVFRGRGRARMQRGDHAGAVDDYTRALLLKPDAVLQAHRGWAYFFAEAPALALHDFEAACRLDPADVDARVGRGLARVALGQNPPAVTDAEEALRRAPESPEMLHNIACIFARAGAGSHPRAIAALRLALHRVPASERWSYWCDKVLPDPYLETIRQNPGFLGLCDEISGAIPCGFCPKRPRPPIGPVDVEAIGR
jgi:tetratricopeptide (TPR) repeat protein